MSTDNKNSKKLNGTLIKESLMDYNNLAQKLEENVTDSVKALLSEQVKEAYASILNESEDDDVEEKEYDVEEVDDTNDDATDDEQVEDAEATEETDEVDDDADAEGTEPEDDQEATEDDVEEIEVDGEETPEGDFEDDLDFEKYKVSDNEYDFRNAKDDEIVKIYKRLNNDDQVTVVKDDDKVSISDKETGAEYIIDLSGNDNTSEITDENFTDDMKESRIYEIALNEYDSNVGYTDNYQDKDVMTSDGVQEPGNGRDIDDGVPHTTAKPWSNKKDGAPFNKKTQTNEIELGEDAPEVEETVVQKGGTNRGRAKSHVPNTEEFKKKPFKHNTTAAADYQGNPIGESIVKKADRIFEENKKLKEELNKITDMLKEAAVTNVNLGGIIKLISENSTTKEEKRDIINRFTNEVHTIEESKSLYNTISNELKKNPHNVTNINEEKEFGSSNAEVINESKFYQDEGLMSSLGLMHKICK